MQGNDSLIDYEKLVSEAMRDAMRRVLRSVLTDVARDGLPGDHHFYISFNTNAPGAVLSKRLQEKYPEEMTIVLQHRFWDLFVHEDRFEVKLQFNSIPERLVVPFEAIRVFVDPSVRFGHQFDEGDGEAAEGELNPAAKGARAGRAGAGLVRTDRRRPAARKRQDKDNDVVEALDDKRPQPVAAVVLPAKTDAPAGQQDLDDKSDKPAAAATHDADLGPKVISLDKFRKK